ncbi:nucleotide exchange factor GrpE [Luteimonas sp. TWI1416]|uniref:nucleotide exchange factor GrpE n=1 Tax=unclassified Luteimonas TaxID=2629088 RepID=UPI0032094EA6
MTQEQHETQHPEIHESDDQATPVEAQLTEQVELLKAELEQVRAQSLLERADLENQRKRLAREIETARRFANERLLSSLVPVFDALEAGLASAPENDPLRAGVELTLRELVKATESNGLRVVAPAAGDAFDPEQHQAMSIVEVPGVPPGAVAQVFQKGYLLNERLLRPAMVVVAKAD